jgi:Flp pilus assembly secretin CpaC
VRGIAKTIKRVEPDADVSITTSNGRVILAGSVPNAPAAARIL